MEENKFEQDLLEAYGWEEVESKNPNMYSYKNEDLGIRMNHYYTTGSITFQSVNGGMKTYRGIETDEQLKEILCKKNPIGTN